MNQWKFIMVAMGICLSSHVAATVVVGEYHIDMESYIVAPERAKRTTISRAFRGTTIVKPTPEVPKYKLVEEQPKTWFERQTPPKRIDRPTEFSRIFSKDEGLIPKSEKIIQREDLSLMASAPKQAVDYSDLFRSIPGSDLHLKSAPEKKAQNTSLPPRPANGRIRRAVGRHLYTPYSTLMHAREMKEKLALEREVKWRKYEWRDLKSEGYSTLAIQVEKEIEQLEQSKKLTTETEPVSDSSLSTPENLPASDTTTTETEGGIIQIIPETIPVSGTGKLHIIDN
jgi:hypothetical protein